MHHPDAQDDLPELFAASGLSCNWSDRQASMVRWFGSAAITSITARHPSYPLGSLNGSDDSMRLNGGTNSQPSHPYTAPEPELGGSGATELWRT